MEKLLELTQTKFFSSVANLAVQSLVDEVELTPKPGLVDQLDAGSHDDLTFDMMKASATSLKDTFFQIAEISYHRLPSQSLREDIAAIGRAGEQKMFEVTNGVNTHKGAIWALGLLVSATASGEGRLNITETLDTAGKIARFPDSANKVPEVTNGRRVKSKYGVKGAKEQAEKGFPHILKYGLPALHDAREIGMSEDHARKYTLLNLIAHLDDTCILHRGGMSGLHFAKRKARELINKQEMDAIADLNDAFKERNLSPGGSADLFAATIFLDQLSNV